MIREKCGSNDKNKCKEEQEIVKSKTIIIQ